MRIRPRFLLAGEIPSLVNRTVSRRWGIRVFIIYTSRVWLIDSFRVWFKTGMIQNGYDSKRVWFKRMLLKLSEYTVSSYSAHGASCTLSIWFSLHLRREIHGVGSNGMWWTYWVSKGAMDSVHVRTRPHQSLRIHRIRDSAHSASCTLTRKPYLSAFTYDEKYMEWVPMGCGGHIG